MGPYGAGKEARTLDLYLGKVSLYQLSYSRNAVIGLPVACYLTRRQTVTVKTHSQIVKESIRRSGPKAGTTFLDAK